MTKAQIPAGALSGMDGWEATVAWSWVPERVTWRLRSHHGEVRYLKVVPLGQDSTLSAERDRMLWAEPLLAVPKVLDYGQDDAFEWLLTAALPGVSAIEPDLLAEPPNLVPRLAGALRNFHTLPVARCPFDCRLAAAVPIAQKRVAAGLVNASQDLHSDHDDVTPEEALDRLLQRRPQEEDLVVCHGDFCLPNVLFHHGQISGYIDLGKLGVADRWWDLAVATWSVTWNLGPGWEDLFLEAYGVQRDPSKVAFYRLLYDLSP